MLEAIEGFDRRVCGEAIVLIGGERRRSSPEPPHRLVRAACGGAVRRGFARGDVQDLRLDGEQVADALGGGEAEHALVEDDAQLAERAEDLDPEHQHHHQRGQLHAPGLHAMSPEPERHRGPERDAHVADAAGQGVGAEQPHGGLEERVPALLEQPGARAALAEGGQRPQPLDRVEELGAVGLVGLRAREAVAAVPAVPEGGEEEGGQRGGQDHPGERQVDRGHDREDQERGQRGDEELRQVLAEVDLELLHALDHREDDVAGAGLGEVGGTERGDLRVERRAQPRLDAGRGVVGDHRAPVLEEPAERDEARHAGHRPGQSSERVAREQAAQHPAEQGEPRGAHEHREEPGQGGARDPQADAAGEGPEPAVDVHGRLRPARAGGRPPRAPCGAPRARSPPPRPRCRRSRSGRPARSCRCGRAARR